MHTPVPLQHAEILAVLSQKKVSDKKKARLLEGCTSEEISQLITTLEEDSAYHPNISQAVRSFLLTDLTRVQLLHLRRYPSFIQEVDLVLVQPQLPLEMRYHLLRCNFDEVASLTQDRQRVLEESGTTPEELEMILTLDLVCSRRDEAGFARSVQRALELTPAQQEVLLALLDEGCRDQATLEEYFQASRTV